MIESEIQIAVKRLGQKTVYLNYGEIVSELDLASLFHLGRQFFQIGGTVVSSHSNRQPTFNGAITGPPTIVDTFLISECFIDNIFGPLEDYVRQEFIIAGSPYLVEQVSYLLSLIKNKYLPKLSLPLALQGGWNNFHLFRIEKFDIHQYQSAIDVLRDLENNS